MNKNLDDRVARERIARELNTTFLVEAGAGSGKTTSLVERMLALVASGACTIDNLAAITFTRKAAAELKSRFQIKLEKSLRTVSDPNEQERLEHSLHNLHLAFLGTIHSFCARLLRERPVEAGLTPDFSEIEGLEERLLQQRAWHEYLQKVRLEQPKVLERLAELDIRPQDLAAAYDELCLYPDVTMFSQPEPYTDLKDVRQELLDFVRLAAPHIPPQQPDKGWDALQSIIHKCQRWDRAFDLTQDKFLLRLLAQLDKEGKVTQNRWLSKDAAKEAARSFAELRQERIQPALQQWRQHRHHPLLQFLLPATEYYQSLRQKEHKLNFQDLLMRTAELLRQSVEVRSYFQERYTHLLVDEFQDTDPIQAEIMLLLTASDAAEQDWSKASPRPGALFVVGDPKQSIYRFRRADISTYNQVKGQIQSTGGEVLHLTSNFRSVPSVISMANTSFADIFPQHSPIFQAQFLPMDAARPPSTTPDHGLRIMQLPEVLRNTNEKIALHDAEYIAAFIRHALDGGLQLDRQEEEKAAGVTSQAQPADFLILVRKKKNMHLYASALEQYQIPYSISGGSDFTQSRELYNLLPLLRCIADPTDALALLATLRGPFFGLSDEVLLQHKLADGRFSLFAEVPPHPHHSDINTSLSCLKTYMEYAQSLTPSSAIERIVRDLGLLPLTLAGELAKSRASYLLQALELLRANEKNGSTTFMAAVTYLSELLESGVEEDLDIEGSRSPGVRIMNLHKAKGLEAPVVFLANPTQHAFRDATLHVSRYGTTTPTGHIAITRQASQFVTEVVAQPPDWSGYMALENTYLAAEEDRLLYVAATRAKNLLVVSIYPKKMDKSSWQALAPYLEDAPVMVEDVFAPPPQQQAPPQGITPVQLAKTREEMQQTLSSLANPTYRQAVVTQLTKGGAAAPRRTATGKGASWGNVVHRALELMLGGLILDASSLVALLQAEGRSPDDAPELVELLTAVSKAPLWQRALDSQERYTEVPFGSSTVTSHLSGIIDLAFRETEGWVLVDFKSDHIIDDDHLHELKAYYTPQIETYGQQFTLLTGQPVKECALLFTAQFLTSGPK